MNKINEAYVGSDFDDFLVEEGILVETTARAEKRQRFERLRHVYIIGYARGVQCLVISLALALILGV